MDSTSVVCADCDAKNPQWASINRGVFVCDECNAIHRQLGRHVSHTKHLYKSLWRPSQLFMVQYLALAGANGFWEHVLLESFLTKRNDSSKTPPIIDKKPQPDSPLHPTKADFIRKKYLFHGFFKLPNVIHLDDLNQQLHASVRTAVLETSLYLLALGANPNYIHPVKGTSPVHVACQYEQIGQLELLLAYGGDVCLRSDKGVTSLEIALEKVQKSQQHQHLDAAVANACSQQQAPWSPLIDCLVLSFYELTDGLSFYLCRRVPDHKAAVFMPAAGVGGLKNGTGEVDECRRGSGGPFKAFYGPGHFLVAPKSVKDPIETLGGEADRWGEAKAKASALDNATFEDLCIDVYDEADRRLTNSFLEPTTEAVAPFGPYGSSSRPLPPGGTVGGRPHSMTAMSGAGGIVPSSSAQPSSLILYFLPPNTAYTSVRNQARQKLGRLSMTAFRALVIDVLYEAARRLVPLLESSSALPLAVVRPKVRHEYTTYREPVNGARMALNARDDDEILALAVDGGGYCVSNRATNTTASTSVDDPVYDQVAVETEVGTVTRVSISAGSLVSATAVCSTSGMASSVSPTTTALILYTASESSQTDQLQLCQQGSQEQQHVSDESSTSTKLNAETSPSRLASASPSSGRGPGSRRLHLATTKNFASYRASVPTSNHKYPFGGMHKPLTTNTAAATTVSSATSGDSTCCGSPERCTAPTMLQQSQEALMLSFAPPRPTMLNAEVQAAGLCCGMVEAEVQRLRQEREKAMQQIVTFTEQLRDLEMTCERLTEENNALKAAFLAGMVKTHEASRSTPAACNLDGTSKFANIDNTDHNGNQNNASVAPVTKTSTEVDNESEEEDEGYNNEGVRHHPRSAGNRSGGDGGAISNGLGNYAMGSQCLDSGMLLRQGISLWARSSSPADAVEVVTTVTTTTVPAATAAAAPILPQSSPSTAGVASNRSYVNLQNSRPSAARTPIGKQFQPTSSSAANVTAGGLHEVEASGDYTAPNETGTPSPAPVLPAAGRSSIGGGQIPRPPPANFVPAGSHRSGEVIVEYSMPTQVGGGSIHLKNTPAPPSGATSSAWKYPPYERIVRGVECIIVRIRALLDAANGRRMHEQVRSAQLIQAAVQDLVVLFPPISKCQQTVSAALASLMSNSQKLRLYCEAATTESSAAISSGNTGNSNQLITFAHEIASAAKAILNFFQAERH